MIRVVTSRDSGVFSMELNEMFRARAAVFGGRMGWAVDIDGEGREVDDFDRLHDPAYLLAIGDDGAVRGSLRLLPTAGPTMLRSCFAGMFDGDIDVTSGTVWECTRFCVHPIVATAPAARKVSSELLLGICELGLSVGLTQVTGVYEHHMERIYRRIGWSPDRLASNRDGTIHIGLWDVDRSALDKMRARSGIRAPVLDEGYPFAVAV